MKTYSREHVCALILPLILLFSCYSHPQLPKEERAIRPVDRAVESSEPDIGPSILLREPELDDQVSPFVRRIFEDRTGNLWLGTNGDGVCRYDGQTLEYFTIEDGFGGRAVRAIVEDDAGSLWFATSGGVTKYEGGAFVNFTEGDGLSSSDVWSLCVDSAGRIWAGTWGGACQFEAESRRFVPFSLPPAPKLDPLRGVHSLNIVHCIMEDRSGNMWFSVGAGGVHRYDGESLTHISEKDGLCNDSVNCILEAQNGDVWFATHHSGVCRYDGKSFTHVMESQGLSGIEVWSLYEDKSGNIWFPSEGFGVYRYDGESFTNYSKIDGLASLAIQCIHEDRDGRLWFGGWLGLYRFDGNSFVNVTREGPWQ